MFTLVFELARPQKFGNAQTNILTNRQTDILTKELLSRKNVIFSMFTYKFIFVDQIAMVSPNFFNRNSFSRFLDISKKRRKKSHVFHARLQYLTTPCMVK